MYVTTKDTYIKPGAENEAIKLKLLFELCSSRAAGYAECSELVFKNIGDSAFAPERAAILAKSTFGGTLMADSAGLATNALRACEEKNRFMTILSDGDAADHELTVQRLKEARESGVLTFGIYLSSDPIGYGTRDKLNELYGGEGNWTQIWSVRELPNTVGKRLATLFKRMKK